MEELQHSIGEAHTYPSNLRCSDTPALILDGIRQELQAQASRIFCDDQSATVDIIEAYDGGRDATFSCVRNHDELQEKLWAPMHEGKQDPRWRMMFWYARSSRDPLHITLRMAQLTLTYHQVMHAFTESIFFFGFREHSEDSALTSFQSRNSISAPQPGLKVPRLGRSGRIMEQCYGLKSVERSAASPDWPWSLRLCSLYHSFDFESGQSFWIVIKANRLIEKLVRDAMMGEGSSAPGSSDKTSDSIIQALRIHGLVAQWCGSDWQFYVKFLESQLQEITRPTLSVTMDADPASINGVEPFTDELEVVPPIGICNKKNANADDFSPLKWIRTSLRPYSAKLPILKEKLSTRSDSGPVRSTTVAKHQFLFKDLPRVHFIEEKANGALDTIGNNEEILGLLKDEYEAIEPELRLLQGWQDIKVALRHFNKIMTDIQRSLRQHHGRLEKLLRLLRDRRTLLEGILNYENTRANQLLAEQANLTANNMELIAQETQLETVSMRVITLVTLFFLPGTFISTLMSTPIVTFKPGSSSTSDGSISAGALGLFAAVSLPLVFLTFVTWWIVYWWEHRKQKRRRLKGRTAHVV